MNKSVLFTSLGVTVVVLVVGGFLLLSKNKEDSLKLVENSVELSETISKLYKGQDTTKSLKANEGYLSDNVFIQLDSHLAELKSLNEVTLNITEYYTSRGFDDDSDPISDAAREEGITDLFTVAGDLDDIVEEEIEDYEELEDDYRIYAKGGSDYILVKDLNFDPDIDVVTYKGVNMAINKSEVPQTYDMLVKNPNYFFNYVTHRESTEKNLKYIDVLFEAVNNSNNTLVIRVYNDGKQVTGFEVR